MQSYFLQDPDHDLPLHLSHDSPLHPSPDSLSPTPSPQPFNSHLVFETGEGRSRRGRREEGRLGMNRGHWSTEENKRYHWFLEIHHGHFVNRHMRRMDKIFKSMELFVATRQAEQCRSHHQKMEKKYHNFIAIIANLRNIHYASSDVEPLLQDMARSDVFPHEGLATLEEMRAMEGTALPAEPLHRRKTSVARVEAVAVQAREEEKEGLQGALAGAEEEKSEECLHSQEQFHGNMLDQSHNNIGQLSLYHEDNSCLFASIFK